MNRYVRLLGRTGLLAGAVFVVIFAVRSDNASRASAAPASAPEVYLDKCSVCHAQDGSGNTAKGRKLKVKNLRSPEVQKLSEAEMTDIVAKGKGKDMDGFEKELGPDMVKQIVTYYRSMGKQ